MHKKLYSRPLFLASVSNSYEARIALMGGAEIIDCKNPNDGPLGALPLDIVQDIVQTVNKRVPVSATIGNRIDDLEKIYKAALEMSQTGVDFIKVGFFVRKKYYQYIRILEPLTKSKTKIIGLFFAELPPKFNILDVMSSSGFYGVMIDTANKKGAALPDVMPTSLLIEFIKNARTAKLFVGLAGALRLEHLDQIICLKPDVIGFRGALCNKQKREDHLDAKAVLEIASKFKSFNSYSYSSKDDAVELRP